MPIYAYRCSSCGHAQDVLRKISDPPLDVCPACAAATFVKQVTAAGFQLKGSGWYVTDFRGDKKPGKAAETEGGSAAETNGAAATEAAPANGAAGPAQAGKPAEAAAAPAAKKGDAAPAPAPAPAPAAAPATPAKGKP
jgi:putative FmdB family regulatory protein